MEVETLTVEEVAKYLRVSRQTVYAGKIPHFKVGTKVRVKRSDLEAMTNTSGDTK